MLLVIRVGKKQALAYKNQSDSNFFLTDLDVDEGRKKKTSTLTSISISTSTELF
jgi:hypothetical protein